MTEHILTVIRDRLEQARRRGLQMDGATPEQAYDAALFAVIEAIEDALK